MDLSATFAPLGATRTRRPTPVPPATATATAKAAAFAVPDPLAQLVQAERLRAERLLSAIRLLVVLVLGAAAVMYAQAIPPELRRSNAAVLIVFGGWSLAQAILCRGRVELYPRWLSAISPVADATAVSAIILCYGLFGSASVALKAPIVAVYFVILGARPMTGSATSARITATAITLQYVIVVALLLSFGHNTVMGDPITAASSAAVSVLDEVTKLALLATSGAVATYATAWHERVLRGALVSQLERDREARDLNAHLQEADKLAALGTLAASIAHEVTSPLATIALSAEMVARDMPMTDARTEIEAIALDARRTAVAVRELLMFARRDEGTRLPVSVSEVTDRVLVALRHLIREKRVTIVRNVPPELPLVVADAGSLERVIVNLVINAVQAMDAQAGAKEVRITASHVNGFLTLEIEDNGPGFADGVAGKIFERFYTTKPAGKGTGLGLWMVAEVIAAHSGTIEAIDTGNGARFAMTIPVNPTEVAA